MQKTQKKFTIFEALSPDMLVFLTYFLIDSASVVLALYYIYTQGGNYTDFAGKWVIAFYAIQFLVILINLPALANNFPNKGKAIAMMFLNKFIAFGFILLATNIESALMIYVITEAISLNIGFSILLIIYRFTIPGGLRLSLGKKKLPLIQKIKHYFAGQEIIPIVLFCIPMFIFGIIMTYIGYFIFQDSLRNFPKILLYLMWFLAIGPLIYNRYTYLDKYFTSWFESFHKMNEKDEKKK